MKATKKELSEELGKTTARLAKLAYKVQNVLEERNEQLKNHYDLQHPFRQGFLLAMELVTKTIAQTEVNKISSNLPVISSSLTCKNCNGFFGININHQCYKCLEKMF